MTKTDEVSVAIATPLEDNVPQRSPTKSIFDSNLVRLLIVIAVAGIGFVSYEYAIKPALSSSDNDGAPTPLATNAPTASPTTTRIVTKSPTTTPGESSSHKFVIDLLYIEPEPTASVKAAFAAAAEKWGNVLTTDWQNLYLENPGDFSRQCGDVPVIPANYAWDDLFIYVKVGPIDEGGNEDGNILGQAYNCLYWTEPGDPKQPPRPRGGVMIFDEFDLNSLEEDGTLNNVILHEMGHVIGIGTMWNATFSDDTAYQLLSNDVSNPRYLGAGGSEGLADIGGGDNQQPKVEENYGPGTALSHWDEETYTDELMSGFVSVGASPLSALTVKSLKDLGHTINATNIDPYMIPSTRRRMEDARVGHKMVGDYVNHEMYDLSTLGVVVLN